MNARLGVQFAAGMEVYADQIEAALGGGDLL
jgi:hypothetical protein